MHVRINRPSKLNSLRETTAAEILQIITQVECDREIHGMVLLGNEKAFSTGIDTSEFKVEDGQHFDFYRFRKRARQIGRLFREIREFTKPVICAIEGYALGGGLELALMGDIIVAGSNAQFGLPETRLGMMPGGGGTQTLPRLIGRPLAKELIWTGRRLSAVEAERHGLLNHVTEPGRALEKVREITGAIDANAPLPVMLSKSVIDRGADMSLANGLEAEGDASFLLYFSKDRLEGLNAFGEKRRPNFRGE